MTEEVEKIVLDIIENQMGIDSQRIWIDDQNVEIPQDNDLFITIGFQDSTQISNNKFLEDSGDSTIEVQTSSQFENIKIDLISRNSDARKRRNEVLLALTSIYSEQQQEKYQFKIFRIPVSFIRIPEAEGGSNINRFSIVIVCQTWLRKENLLTNAGEEFFETFPTRVDTEDTIGETDGAINFTLTE